MKRNISILGSTGSVGTQALEVARELNIQISAISGCNNVSLLEQQIREFKPKIAAVFDESNAKNLKDSVKDTNTKIYAGIDGLCEAACVSEAEMVVTAVSGMIGLKPTLAAINVKKDIALANKETLVAGGEFVMNLVKEKNVNILPVDSEHSAIFQCLNGCGDKCEIKRLILTSSGGPFFGKNIDDLQNVTLDDALKHPSWNMGAKITIDSATLMNKGLEVIEAAYLFGLPEEKIDIIVHRESVVHSMVEYLDGSVIAQMGTPSMKTPIQYSITYPERLKSSVPALDFAKVKNLSFFEPDTKTFEAINLCRNALKQGGSAPIILNAANEEAVTLFLNGKIKFLDIIALVKEALRFINYCEIKSVEDVFKIDKIAREFVKNKFESLKNV